MNIQPTSTVGAKGEEHSFGVRWLRQALCTHAVYYDTDMERRADGLIHAPCYRCGKALSATHGLALPALLHCRPQPAQLPPA